MDDKKDPNAPVSSGVVDDGNTASPATSGSTPPVQTSADVPSAATPGGTMPDTSAPVMPGATPTMGSSEPTVTDETVTSAAEPSAQKDELPVNVPAGGASVPPPTASPDEKPEGGAS